MTAPLFSIDSRRKHLSPSQFWSIRQELPAQLKILLPTIGLAVPLLLWSILSYGGFTSAIFLPSPTTVLAAGWKMWQDGTLLPDTLFSIGRVLGGFLVAAMIGIPLGIATGTFSSIDSLFKPLVGTVRYMPVNAFIPMVIIWVGLDENAKIMMIFMGIVLFNAIMIADAVKFISDDLLNAAYTLGANRREILWKVILPASLPSILNTLRVNIAGAWNVLIFGESIAAQSGLGLRIIKSQRVLNTENALFCIVLIGLIGLVTDYIFHRLTIALTPWADNNKA
jgi:NitT/TauT family transport system permease protein